MTSTISVTIMTEQEIFNTVATHLFAQGAPAVSSIGECQYRGPNGTKCAIGCLIPDENYTDYSEGYAVVEALEQMGLVDQFPHTNLLSALQSVHDGSDGGIYSNADVNRSKTWVTTENMRLALQEVAELYNLDATILSTLSFADR